MSKATKEKKARTALFDGPDWADIVAIRAIRLGDALAMRISVLFAEFDLTILQYNVLRMLYVRDENAEGLPVGTIGGSLMVRGPDVTRLIDRLEKAGLIERVREASDRRVVKVRLRPAGTALVEKVHPKLIAHNRAMLAHLSGAELQELAGVLSKTLDGLA